MRQITGLVGTAAFEEALAKARQRLETESQGHIRLEASFEAVSGLRAARPWEVDIALEAIILEELRPPYLIRQDRIHIEAAYDHVAAIHGNLGALEEAAMNVGRVDLIDHLTHDFVGTGWLVGEGIAVTNRHVARTFAQPDWSGKFPFIPGRDGRTVVAELDFMRQFSTVGRRVATVLEVLYIAGDREPDFAFMKVQASSDARWLDLSEAGPTSGMPVAAIGYPAWDGNRNDPKLMQELFGGVYDVKRFSPGLITGLSVDEPVATADYTSLGGNSGSPVIELDTAKVVGLHFAGAFREANYLVTAGVLASALRSLKPSRFALSEAPRRDPVTKSDTLKDRTGYDDNFLGEGSLRVEMPSTGRWQEDTAVATGTTDNVLRYEHFSVVQCRSRRLPLFTAVNIDGSVQRKLGRKGVWRLDPRLALEDQIGNELYRGNALDRGHMVRRRDPGWGTEDAARRGEDDTFHYTNSIPQHEDLNQKSWVGLEDYLLAAAETLGFKASVFTGPVFKPTDRALASQPGAENVRIPEEFWKVAVMVAADTGRLHATAYVLSHGPLIAGMLEGSFVYGRHETYQVPIPLIERSTGLDFGKLKGFDPIGGSATLESKSSVIRITGPQDLAL